MLELTKKQTIAGLTDFCFSVPEQEAERLEAALRDALHIIGFPVSACMASADDEKLYSADEVFPEGHPGMALRGMRIREDLTQKAVAERLGIKQHHVSEMERGTRKIGLDMAKRIGEAFNISYKVFL